jgi:hypothetical protein
MQSGERRSRRRRIFPSVESLERRVMPSIAPLLPLTYIDEIADGAVILRTREETPPDGTERSPPPDDSDPPSLRPDFNLLGDGLEFNLVPSGGMSAQAIAGFQAAADLWSLILRDDIMVNININFTSLGAGILGSTSSQTQGLLVSQVKTALTNDAKSLSDLSAVATLPAASSLAILTSNPTTGADMLDNNGSGNNTTLDVSRANAKALGLRPAGDAATDGSITFSSNFTWDFDRSNGITAGAFDFIGVAAHEIGHLLGFFSGADTVDATTAPGGTPQSLDGFRVATPLDLFRHSAASEAAAGAHIDLRAGTATKYFSVDGGLTQITTFSTGRLNGDGNQASHWKDNLFIGIMDPTAAPAEYADITDFDVQAFDAMGWDVRMDLGDAPDTGGSVGPGNYQTNLSDNGPRHLLFKASGLITDQAGAAKVFLGADVTGELSALQNGSATGDTDNGIVSFPALTRGSTQNITVTSTGGGAILNYFFDFNQDGDFIDAGEASSATLSSTSQSVPVVIPANAKGGTTFARFRISTAGGLSALGAANDGEVEDYQITISNVVPVAQPSSVTTNEDTPKSFAVSNFLFTDVESDPLTSITISSLSLASGDTLKLSGTDVTVSQTISAANIPNLVYTPAMNLSGSARSSFNFTVNDSGLGTVAAAMTINVTPVNDVPVAQASNVTTSEDTPMTFAVPDFLFGDAEGNGLASITISSLSLAAGDTLKLSGTDVTANQTIAAGNIANLVYTPAPDGNGTPRSSFNFKVNDSEFGTVAAAMTINVTAVNDLPVAQASSVTTNEDTSKTFAASEFLFAEPDGDSLASITVSSLSLASGDTLKLSGTDVTANQTINAANIPNLVYTPFLNANGSGRSSFNFKVNDATSSGTVAAAMTINVTAVNDVPAAQASSVTTSEDTPKSFAISDFLFTDVEGDDLASITISSLSLAVGDSLKLNGTDVATNQTISAANIASLLYTPALNANGLPRSFFDFKVNDSGSGTVVATMTINVTAINDVPVAQANGVTTSEDTTKVFAATDFPFTDTEGDSLTSITISELSLASGDTLTLSGTDVTLNQTISAASIPNLVYSPALNANGSGRSSFNFKVNDSGSGTAAAAMTLNVSAVNDVPVAQANGVTTSEDTPKSFAVSDFLFTDVEGDGLSSITLSSLSLAAGDTLRLNATDVTTYQTILAADIANLVYTPAQDALGSPLSSFDFRVNDSDSGTVAATMTIGISPINDAPVMDISLTPTLAAIAIPQPKNSVIAGTPIATLVANVTDVDGDPKGIALTGFDGRNGKWEYTTDGGANWVDFKTVVGLADSNALLLASDAATQVRFTPNKAAIGVRPFNRGFADLTYRAWDQSNGADPLDRDDATDPLDTSYSSKVEHAWVAVGKTIPTIDVSGRPVLKAIVIPRVVPNRPIPSPVYTVKFFLGLLAKETDRTKLFGIAVSGASGTGPSGAGEWQYLAGLGGWKTLGAVSDSAALLLRPTDKMRFMKGPTFNGHAEITYHTWDMVGGLFGTKVSTAVPGFSAATETAIANAAPVLTPAHPTLGTAQRGIPSGSMPVSALLGAAATDVEQSTLGMYVYAPRGGTWEYTLNGADWIKVTRPVYLVSTAQVRFKAAATAKVGMIASLAFRAWDQTVKSPATLSKVFDRITVEIVA